LLAWWSCALALRGASATGRLRRLDADDFSMARSLDIVDDRITARIAEDGSFHILSAPTLDGELSGRELVLLGSIARNNAVSIWKATDFFDPAPEPFQGTATTVTTTYGAALIKSVLKFNFELDTGRWFYANDASYSKVKRVLKFTLRRNAR
jgi:hypothetical protein